MVVPCSFSTGLRPARHLPLSHGRRSHSKSQCSVTTWTRCTGGSAHRRSHAHSRPPSSSSRQNSTGDPKSDDRDRDVSGRLVDRSLSSPTHICWTLKHCKEYPHTTECGLQNHGSLTQTLHGTGIFTYIGVVEVGVNVIICSTGRYFG